MNEMLVFDTEAAALAWCAKIDALLGYPNPATKTERYTAPMPGDDGKFYVPTNPHCPAIELTKTPIERRIAPADIKFDPDTGKVAEVKGVKLTNAK